MRSRSAAGASSTACCTSGRLSAEEVTHGFCDNRPVVAGVYDLDLGRIATILIPRFDTQLYEDPDDLTAVHVTDDVERTPGARPLGCVRPCPG